MAAMVTATTELPLLGGYGHSVTRVPRYKRMKTLNRPKIVEKRKPDSPAIALRKVGAFGVAVKREQLVRDYSSFERVTSQTEVKEQTIEEEKKEENDTKRLPPVEFSIRKKIKHRIMLRHAETLTSSDRQVIEDLRHDLRTGNKEPDGAKSVLEAMGDPKIRETRFYHEPLSKFLAGNGKPKVGRAASRNPFTKHLPAYALNTPNFPSDIRLVNIMVPPSQQHFNTPVDMRHTVSNAQTFRKHHGTPIHGYPTFPKVINPHQLSSKVEERGLKLPLTHPYHGMVDPSRMNYSLTPSSGHKNDNDYGRKTEFSLPSISLNMQQEPPEKVSAKKPIKPSASTAFGDREGIGKRNYSQPMQNATKQNSRTTRQRMGRPPPKTRPGIIGQPAATQKTASGKSHLIGPMNKMDMIVEYSKLLQSKVINYEQYIKKLTKLSLHKVDLGNSGLRHYHIVRDGSTGMKPRLARVDVYPTNATQAVNQERSFTSYPATFGASKQPENYERGYKTAEGGAYYTRSSTVGLSRGGVGTAVGKSYTPHDNPTPYKNNQLRLSRVSIGEGIPESRFESYNSGYDVAFDEYLTYDDVIRLQGTDIERYRHAHRPTNADKHGFHWNHIAPQNEKYPTSGRAITQGEQRKNDSWPRELYSSYAGKLPSSREIKKRLNFCYPSYDVMVDGTSQLAAMESNESHKESNPTGGHDGVQEDTNNDPDYLAITFGGPGNDKMTSTDRELVTSSLSVHDVTLPTELKVITGGLNHKNGTQRKGLVLGAKDPKTRDASSSPNKGVTDNLNITPVAITSSSLMNTNPSSNKSPYYVSQDDFTTSGTDGVLQTHLSSIYMYINKAKVKKGNDDLPSNNSPPNIQIKKIQQLKTTLTAQAKQETEESKIVANNAKLLQASKRFPPPNSPPPQSIIERSEAGNLEPQNIVVPNLKNAPIITSQMPVSSNTNDNSHLTVRRSLPDTPPPTALLLQAREDEITSAGSDDETNDIISVNVTTVPGNGTMSPSPDKLNNTEIRLLTASVESGKKNRPGSKDKPHLEIVITTLPAAPPGSEIDSSDEDAVPSSGAH